MTDDLISRQDALIAVSGCSAKMGVFPTVISYIEACEAIRNIPSAQVEGEVTADDIVEGIEWGHDLHWSCPRVVYGRLDGLVNVGQGYDKHPVIALSKDHVADILNGAIRRGETVRFPEGHKLNPKKPTLLEAVTAYLKSSARGNTGTTLTELWEAIDREREKEKNNK